MNPIALARVCVLFFLLPGGALASNPGVPTPTELPGGRIVSLQEVRDLADGGARLIDVRSALNYGRGHIPGAVLAPYKGNSANRVDFDPSLDRFSLSALPEKRNTDVLIYSHGDTGWKSYKAAVTAIRSGYTRVHWFRKGLAAWEAVGLPVER